MSVKLPPNTPSTLAQVQSFLSSVQFEGLMFDMQPTSYSPETFLSDANGVQEIYIEILTGGCWLAKLDSDGYYYWMPI